MIPTLTPSSRETLLDELEVTRFDLVIAGGGITGAAVARDAAARGLQVALLEANDFAAGTSSRSSKLIHGGLRYLASGEIGFVRQTARERAAVHAMAPHLAEPCWMVVPARNRVLTTVHRAGISLYELLGAIDGDDRHQQWRGREITDREPHLRTDLHPWAVAYREYLTDDTRLVLGVLRAAVRSGAVAASRVPVIGLIHDSHRVDGVIARCATTGRKVEVRGDVVVNAGGPWVNDLARMEHDPPTQPMHLSKGVHVVLDRKRFPTNHLVICQAEDKRPIFVIPRGPVVYVGTTDTTYDGSRPRWPEVEARDVRYLLAPLPRYFDVDPPSPDDVIASWAGLRSLAARPGKAPGELSRQAAVTVGPGGMVSAAGGKLTGFRRMAEEIVILVGQQLGRSLRDGPGVAPLPGAEAAAPGREAADERLARLYGSEAPDVVALGSRPILAGGSVLAGEVDWAIDVEAAHTLEDVIYRRVQAAWFLPAEREQLAPSIADHMARRLGWDEQRRAEELADVRAQFTDELAFRAGATR